MKRIISNFIIIALSAMTIESYSQEKLPFNDLSKAESNVINNKGTETPFTGKYVNNKEKGTYICKKCGAALYYSSDKFESDCGWPSFDDEIKGAVKRTPDADGIRTEITCTACGAHLGHVFTGERFTSKNIRHCVNSVSLDFVPEILEPGRFGSAIFAAVAAGVYPDVRAAASAMSRIEEHAYVPNTERADQYEAVYEIYKEMHDYFGRYAGLSPMHRLKNIKLKVFEVKRGYEG